MSRDIIRTRLTRNGHEVTAVCNGRECLVKAHEEPFDIFILDISMPVKDGLQTLKELKTLPATSRTPTLALSAHSMDRDRQKAIEAGFDEYDTKPLTSRASSKKLTSCWQRLLARSFIRRSLS